MKTTIFLVAVLLFACHNNEKKVCKKEVGESIADTMNKESTITVEKITCPFVMKDYVDSKKYPLIGHYRFEGVKFSQSLFLYEISKFQIKYIYKLKNKTYNIERTLNGVVNKIDVSQSPEPIDNELMSNIQSNYEPVESYILENDEWGCDIDIELLLPQTKLYNGLQRPSFAYISFYFNKGSIKDELFYEYLPLDLEGILIRSDIPQDIYKPLQ